MYDLCATHLSNKRLSLRIETDKTGFRAQFMGNQHKGVPQDPVIGPMYS